MKNKKDITSNLKMLGGVSLMAIYLGIFKLFIQIEGFHNLGVFFLIFIGCAFATGFAGVVLAIIFEEVNFDEGYYVMEKDKCGVVTYKPYCYKYIGKYVIEKEALWNDFYPTEENAYKRIDTIKADKIEAERKRKCKTTFKIKDYE